MISVSRYIDLLKDNNLWISNQSIGKDLLISGVPITDSRNIKCGDAFVCIKGLLSDGHNFIKQARTKGAVLIIQEEQFTNEYPAIRVTNSRKAAALLAKVFFDNPSGSFKLIGITGTNGKTTISMLLWQALTIIGYKTGWIGTLGYRIDSEIFETNNTTPDIMELNSILRKMADGNCKYVVMEVSSHAMALDRVYGLEFDIAIFSNLSREHLDFHKDMNDYYECKRLLFEKTISHNGKCILNIDDEYGRKIFDSFKKKHRDNLITVSDKEGDITIRKQISKLSGSEFEVSFNDLDSLKVATNLVGQYNIMNSILALTALKTLLPEISDLELLNTAMNLTSVRGRLERVSNINDRSIFVDYAHTPDALKNVLSTLQKISHKKLIVVFGAGGDRDKGKRPLMLKEVLEYSDICIITDDNPRYENPNDIIREIVSDADIWKPWWVIRDRKKAIQAALSFSGLNDIVLIAGKGHETYQEIEGVRYPFDDVKIAVEASSNKVRLSNDELFLPIHSIILEKLYHQSSENNRERKYFQDNGYKYISTDSRTIKPESLYFAIKGERFDGHDFVDSILQDTSCCAIVSEQSDNNRKQIRCNDTVEALGLLAKKYLMMFSPLRIAVTGSTGKTTTKEYLSNIFSAKGKVLKTFANENNTIGLSKTIFRIRPEDKTAVFELGTNHFGEIAFLADICNPNMGLITNIGPSHLEFLGDENGVYREKTTLFKRNIQNILFPGDDKRFNEFRNIGKSVGYSDDCSYKIDQVIYSGNETEFRLNNSHFCVSQAVPFYITNIAFAVSTAMEAGLSEQEIALGLKAPIDINFRMQVKIYDECIMIIDCYNANPVSMKAAIEFWKSYNSQSPHIGILGDMLELGESAIDYHKSIGETLNNIDYHSLFTVGSLSSCYHKEIGKSSFSGRNEHYDTVEQLLNSATLDNLPKNAIILVKASHSLHLEKIYELFEQKYQTHSNYDYLSPKE